MTTLTLKSVITVLLITFVWVVGSYELYDTITHFNTQWYWYILALIYTVSLNDIFVHMCCGHLLYEFDPKRIGYKIISFLATVENGWGPITALCLSHRNHHMYSDQGNKDCSNWRIHWYNMIILSPINYIYQAKTDFPDEKRFFAEQKRRYKVILDDLWTWFIEEYSHWCTILFWIVVYLISSIVFFKILIMGRFIMSLYSPFASWLGHTKIPGGYRNFDTPDTSYNNIVLHYLCLCIFPTVLQNNHHGQPYTIEKGHWHRWFEVDLSKYIAGFFRHITGKRK
jgi:hypothetical protein